MSPARMTGSLCARVVDRRGFLNAEVAEDAEGEKARGLGACGGSHGRAHRPTHARVACGTKLSNSCHASARRSRHPPVPLLPLNITSNSYPVL